MDCQTHIPTLFQALIQMDCLSRKELRHTPDEFWTAAVSLAQILARKNITTFPNENGVLWPCSRFYDDWYLYTVPDGDGEVCSLLKMREQEQDTLTGPADGDTPGVTICFLSFDEEILLHSLNEPTAESLAVLNREINRVVAKRGQRHAPGLKNYFVKPQAQAPYLIGTLYVQKIASFSRDGRLPVPEHYASLPRESRLPRFISSNNTAAGRTVCDHRFIFFLDPGNPTLEEALAVLATHTANTSFHSFAAEIRFHARFLTPLARLPLLGRSVYDSAIRADMTIDDREMTGPTPYYDPDSRLVKAQQRYHTAGQYPFSL